MIGAGDPLTDIDCESEGVSIVGRGATVTAETSVLAPLSGSGASTIVPASNELGEAGLEEAVVVAVCDVVTGGDVSGATVLGGFSAGDLWKDSRMGI